MRKIYLLMMLMLTCFAQFASAQNRTVSGTVTEKGGGTLPSVTVKVKGGTQGVVSDVNGKYSITVPAGSQAMLVFSSIGYVTQERVIPAGATMDVELDAVSKTLDEVVAIGYATVRRKDVTGASSSVSAQELALAPVTTAAQALTGKAAGVSVITQSGAPGAASNIVIRGATTINSDASPLYIVDGFQVDDALRQIDINDIESIDVLKDASATSIYGARGANGVILITTKSAKAGKTEINYNGYYGFETLGKKLPVMNASDYTRYQYELLTLAGLPTNWASYFGGNVNDPNFYTNAYSYMAQQYGPDAPSIDWQKQIFGSTAPSVNHNFSINSGTEKTKFLLSYNNTQEDGILSKHNYLKNGVRLKLDHEVFKGLHVNFNTSFQDTRTDGGGSLGGALKLTLLQPPTGGARFTNDQLLNTDISTALSAYNSQYDIYNPTIVNNSVTQSSFARVLTLYGGVDLDITKDIKFHSLGSYLWGQTRSETFDDGATIAAKNNLGPYGSYNNSENYSWQLTNTINWSHSFHNHGVSVLLGQEAYYSQSQNLNNGYYQFPAANFGLNDVGEATGTSKNTYSSGLGYSSLASFFGRASYNYKGRYIANFTMRADGSSSFGPDNKWGYFPSASGAWRISEEEFMKNQNIVSDLKLRVGYGSAGNDNIGQGRYVTSYGSSSYAIGKANFPTLVPGSTLGNAGIKWETTSSTNIGLDMAFLKNRINLSVDVYDNRSANLLYQAPLPPSSGYTNQYQNLASISNRGLEFMLTSTNIASKSFRWKTSYNMSFNRSKVLKLSGVSDNEQSIINYGSRIDFLLKVGQPLGQFYGYQYAGVYTTDDFIQNANGTYTLKPGVPRSNAATVANIKPGDVMYKTIAGGTDASGNPTWSTADRSVIGNASPKFTGGITNTFNYQGFDLTVFMDFAVGGKIFDMNSQRFIGPYLPNENTLDVMNNRYTLVDPATGKETTSLSRISQLNPNQNDPNQLWSLHPDNKIAISDAINYYLEDGTYLRISTATLGYTLPKPWASKVKMKNLRVYCTLNNIHTFTKYKGYDPEVAATSSVITPGIDDSAYPRVKSVVFGVNISF